MRLATGFLIALVACLWLGLAEAASPPAPPTGACPKACNKAGARDKATACNKATACSKASATACAAKKSCDSEATCQGRNGCENAACKDAVMAAMFGKMVIGNEAGHCDKSTACATTEACASEPGCETACTAKKACCQASGSCAAAGSCEAGACEQTACANASTCATTLACNKSTACGKATACAKAGGCPGAACAADGESPQVIATDCASCESGTCCKAKGNRAVASMSCARCAKLAVASDETCEASAACGAGAGCDASACASDACPSTVKLRHLVKAAEHLTAAGLTDEADCVRAMAVEVRQELVALKLAQVASLQAEIAALGGDCEIACESVAAKCEQRPAQSISEWMAAPLQNPSPRQVSVNVKCVEVSLSKLKQLGIGYETMGWDRSDAEGILGFVKALERERIAKVTALPTVVMADGGCFEVRCQEMHLDVQATLLDDQHVRVDIRPRDTEETNQPCNVDAGPGSVPGKTVVLGGELELGKTAVLNGPVQERLTAEIDPETHESKMVRSDVETLILITPELVVAGPAVRSASHQESGAKSRREDQPRVKAIHIFETHPGQKLPKVRFATPAIQR